MPGGWGGEEMRKDRSPTVWRGCGQGDQLNADPIIPWKVASELDKSITNLNLGPLKPKQEQQDKIGPEQRSR
jgi:hypothetical protein